MVAGHQDLGHRHPAELAWSRELRVVEQLALEGFELRGLGAAQDPGINRTAASTTQSAASSPPASTKSPSEISSQVNPARMRSSNPSYLPQSGREPIDFGEFPRLPLVKPAAAPAGPDLVERAMLTFRILDGVKDRFRLDTIPGPPPNGRSSTVHVEIARVGAPIDKLDVELPLTLCDPENALVRVRPDRAWKERRVGHRT